MYLHFLNYVACFFTILFIAFFCWSLKWKLLKRFWQHAKIKAINQKDKLEFIKKQESKGLKPFEFDNGNTVIYAKNGNQAILDHKRLKQETKIIRRQLRKT